MHALQTDFPRVLAKICCGNEILHTEPSSCEKQNK